MWVHICHGVSECVVYVYAIGSLSGVSMLMGSGSESWAYPASSLSAKVSCRPALTDFLVLSSLDKNWQDKRPGDFYV